MGKQVGGMPEGFSEPCEVVDAHRVYLDFMAVYLFFPKELIHHAGQEFLGAENLMAAAEGFDPGKYPVEGFDAKGHGVGVIDHPGVRAVGFDGLSDFLKHGKGAHGPQNAAGAGGVPYGLVNPVFFRGMDIGLHLIKGAGKDGDDHEVGARKGLGKGGDCLIAPVGFGPLGGAELISDDLIVFCGLKINIIESHLPADVAAGGQIAHQSPGPAPGAAADVGNF